MIYTKRILLAEADAATGAAAPVAAPDKPVDVPQAQGAPVITKEVADVIASTVAKAVADVRDSIFAEARRTFTQKKSATKDEAPTTTPAAPAQPDPIRLRSLDRALSKHGHASRLSDSQYRRVEAAFASESPDDAESWVKDYFDGYGTAPTATPQPAQQQAAQPATKPNNEHPVSDRGSPPASKVPLTEASLISMSQSDRDALIRDKGVKWYWEQLGRQMKGVQVRVK